jgi:hypothetical protein
METMEIELLNKEPLIKDLEDYIIHYLKSPENERELKIYFGENRYDGQSIEFQQLGIGLVSVFISKQKPYHIEKINGIIKAQGIYKVANENGWSGRGFGGSVFFAIEIDHISNGFKGLQFRN